MMNIKLKCLQCNCHRSVSLRKSNDEIVCDSCGATIKGTFFDIQKLKIAKKYTVDQTPTKKAFTVQCKHCKYADTPKVENNKGCCKQCNEDLGLTQAFLYGLKEHLKTKND